MALSNIQCLRALAALMVVWLHAKEQIPGMNEYFTSDFGAAGVDLFFVISGLIMVFSTAKKEIAPLNFFIRRLQRIAPLYWLATTFLVLVALVAPQLQRSTTLVWSHVIASYFFIPAVSPSFQAHMWPVLIPGWTLNYEMAFYAVFAVSLFFRQGLRLPFITMVIGAAVAVGSLFDFQGALGFYSNDIMLTFVLGAFVGTLVVSQDFKPSIHKGVALLLVAVVLWFGLESLSIPSRFVNAGIPAAFVVLGCVYLPEFKGRLTLWLELLGDASYSIYLTHIFTLAALRLVVKNLVKPVEGPLHYWIFMACCLLVCSIVGFLSFRYLEQPIARQFKR